MAMKLQRPDFLELLERRTLLSAAADLPRFFVGPLPDAAAAIAKSPQAKTLVMHRLSAGDHRPLTESVLSMEARDAASTKPGNDTGFPTGPAITNAPQSVSTNFIALNRNDVGAKVPPDTMGAIGPSHFVEVINGGVAIYNRAGVRLSLVTLDSFFTVTVGPTTYPRNGTLDPRVLYDRRSGRFFASALEFGPVAAGKHSQNGIILAVSRTSDPTGVWDKYYIDVGESVSFTDEQTLGTDDNGIYLGMHIFVNDGSDDFAKIAATGK